MREAPKTKFARTISMKQREQRLRQSAATMPLRKPSHKIFAKKLSALMKVHGDTHITLRNSILKEDESHSPDIIANWAAGKTVPRTPSSFALLRKVEQKYQLTENYFRAILLPELPSDLAIKSVPACERHLVRWHLPKDFDELGPEERQEIMGWMRVNVLGGSTSFGKYLKSKSDVSFRLRPEGYRPDANRVTPKSTFGNIENAKSRKLDLDLAGKKPSAPAELIREIAELVNFKISTFALPGYQRYSGWAKATAELRAQSYCRIMGAAMASPRSEVSGLGVPRSHLTLALMAFPNFWDWFLAWSEKRRGFFTKYELNMLCDASSLLRAKTGWVRQHPELALRLSPIAGIITRVDIRRARSDWDLICATAHSHLRVRIMEVRRIMRTHRDPFEPILPVLRSNNPLKTYKRVATEILRRMPDKSIHPVEAAEAVRSYLMLRFGMHLGFRQRNLRELLLCHPGQRKRRLSCP